MKKLGADGWVWTEENIDKWITDPKALDPRFPDGPRVCRCPRRR